MNREEMSQRSKMHRNYQGQFYRQLLVNSDG